MLIIKVRKRVFAVLVLLVAVVVALIDLGFRLSARVRV